MKPTFASLLRQRFRRSQSNGARFIALIFAGAMLSSCATAPTSGEALEKKSAVAATTSVDAVDADVRDSAALESLHKAESAKLWRLENFSTAETVDSEQSSAPLLRVHILSIGQADAMLVIGPPPQNRTLLIDAGETTAGAKGFRRYGPRLLSLMGKKHIDYFVVSHFHMDHIGVVGGIFGLVDELGFTIGTAIDVHDDGYQFLPGLARGGYHRFSAATAEWLRTGKLQQRVRPKIGSSQIDLGAGVKVSILGYAGKASEQDAGALAALSRRLPDLYRNAPASENDLSIALKIRAGEFELFTAGDLTGAENGRDDYTPRSHFNNGKVSRETYTNVEKYFVTQWSDTDEEQDVEVYRVNHHGSAYSSSSPLLNVLDPEVMIYSTGGGHGHPSAEVVRRGSTTALQFVTSKLAEKTWPQPSRFEELNGRVVGEIEIKVLQGGKKYWVNDQLFRAFTDAEERGRPVRKIAAEGPAGDDAKAHPGP